MGQCDAAYAERDELVAFLTRIFDSWLLPNPESEDGWAYIVYVHTPQGQLSWHVPDHEIPTLFADLPIKKVGVKKWAWDGHTTEEKYDRLRKIDGADLHEDCYYA